MLFMLRIRIQDNTVEDLPKCNVLFVFKVGLFVFGTKKVVFFKVFLIIV